MNDPESSGDRDLDETIEESFPASDAPANTPETGTRVGPDGLDSDLADNPASTDTRPAVTVTDNRAAQQFQFVVDGLTGVLAYERTARSLVLVHTEVPPPLRGRRYGEALVKAAIEAGRGDGLQIVAVCPFVQAYLRRHPLTG